MKAAEAILTRWCYEDPDRLLQAALRQARELAELVPKLDGLRSQNATLRQQLEIQAKRIAQLEEALLAGVSTTDDLAGPRNGAQPDQGARTECPRSGLGQ